jgi:endonuclease/exonuclease/phosphatase family metal-dependent hydrolase
VVVASTGCSDAAGRAITIVSYNVQNLFDAVEDGHEFAEFRASAGWNDAATERKLAAIADAVLSADPDGPELLALQEVENEAVVAALSSRYLDGLGYRHAVVAPDPSLAVALSNTRVAVLSKLPVRRVGLLQVVPEFDPFRPERERERGTHPPLRAILEVEIALDAGRSLYLFNNHWKSKRGGARETETYRRAAAEVLRRRVATLMAADAAVDVVIAGDLNHDVPDRMQRVVYPTALRPSADGERLLLERRRRASGKAGAIRRRRPQSWSRAGSGQRLVGRRDHPPRELFLPGALDHLLFTPGLADRRGVWYAGEFDVVSAGLLSAAGAPRPFRIDRLTGASDHLPIRATLHVSR